MPAGEAAAAASGSRAEAAAATAALPSMATAAVAPSTTSAALALSSCVERQGRLRRGPGALRRRPGRWFGVHFLRTPKQLARQELVLGANADTCEDALWRCCREMRKKIGFSQHNVTL